MNKIDKSMSEKVRDYIKQNLSATFVEIEEVFERNNFDYQGDLLFGVGEEYPNVFIWGYWNEQAVQILEDIRKDTQIKPHSTSILTYLSDGKALGLPIVKRAYNYKKPHWLPVVLCYEKG